MANFTRNAIRASFLKLVNDRPLSKITVKDITDDCGINRNSFYYHYQDIPSLIQEIFTEEFERIIREHPSIESLEECISIACAFAAENKRAILHIYNSVNRDIFEKYLWRVCDYVVSTYGKTVLKGREIADFDRRVIAHFYKCECFGLIIAWLDDRMKTDVHSQISRFCKLHQGMIEEMLRRSADN